MKEHAAALPWPDERIWVTLKPGWTPDPALRWTIHGSAHTHRGHLHVCALAEDLHMTITAEDIAAASPEARLWLDGFLCGQEADLYEFMGSSNDLYDGYDEDDLARWRGWNLRFRRRGAASPLDRLPPASVCEDCHHVSD